MQEHAKSSRSLTNVLSCGPNIIEEAPLWVKDYVPQIEPFIFPFNTWIEADKFLYNGFSPAKKIGCSSPKTLARPA